jgi:hypothetical protein
MVIAECEVLFEEGKADLVEEGAGAKEELRVESLW